MGISPAGKALVGEHLGPACLAWATWALLRAKEAGLSRLYFVSRDAFLAWRCATILAPPLGIECRYLMVSRQSILPAATAEVSRENLEWAVPGGGHLTYAVIFRRLEINVEQCGPRLQSLVRSKGLHVLLRRPDVEAFWLALEEPQTTEAIEATFASRRRDAVCYLAQEGLLADEGWALVDVGWRLSIQRGINALVRPHVSARGLYIHISSERAPPEATGAAEAMFPASCNGVEPPIATYYTLIEHVVGLAPHGTVLGYTRDGTEWRAICQPLPSPRVEWQAGITDAVGAFAKERASAFVQKLETPEACAAAFDSATRPLLLRPDVKIVRELHQFLELSSDHHNAGAARVARPISVNEWMRLMRAGNLRPKLRRQLHWPEACLQMSPAPMRAAVWIRRRFTAAKRESGRGNLERTAVRDAES